MTNTYSLLLTILVGLFFLVGMIVAKLTKAKKELTILGIGLSFMVMLGMILLDIIPEIAESVIELSATKKWFFIIGFTALGMIVLKALDIFIPHHHHEHHENEKNKKEHNEHLFHIGFVTSISLILHNMIEGISIYITSLTNLKAGLMLAFAVSLHNLPLGIEIAVGMDSSKTKKKIKWITMTLLILSSFMGAFGMFLMKEQINEIMLSALLCITFGMLIYITIFELLREIWNNRQNKMIYIGLGIGLILNIIMVIL